MQAFRLFVIYLVFFPICIGINGCQVVDKSKSDQVFYYNEDQSIATLDPAFVKSQSEIWVVSQMLEGLVEYDDSLRIQPCLAKSWEISPDGLVYTFHLRRDVFFHDNPKIKHLPRPFLAQDVVESFKRIADPKTASPGAWIFNDKLDLTCFDSGSSSRFPVVATNDSTVSITLKQVYAPFIDVLAMPYCFIVPVDWIDHDFRKHPIGTGPFLMKQWEEEVSLLLHKNQRYYRFENGNRLPYLQGVCIENVKNKQTAFMKFVQGEYDFFNGIDASIKDELLTRKGLLKPKYNGAFTLLKQAFLNTEYIGFNIDPAQSTPNLAVLNADFRKALGFAIDKQKLIQYLRNGVGMPADKGFVPYGFAQYPYAEVNEHQHQLDSAKYYLKRSRVDVTKMQAIVINTTQDYLDLMVYIQKEWNQLGVPVKIEVHPSSFLRQLRNDQKIHCWRGSWIADYSDPENYLVCFESKNFSPLGPNYAHFKQDRFDALLQDSRRELSPQRRNQLLAQADNLLMDQMPYIVLFYDESIRMHQNWVKGLTANPINFLRLRSVQKTAH